MHADMNKERICPGCGRVLEEGSLYCEHCGQDLANTSHLYKNCIGCGAKIHYLDRYCDKCGQTQANDKNKNIKIEKYESENIYVEKSTRERKHMPRLNKKVVLCVFGAIVLVYLIIQILNIRYSITYMNCEEVNINPNVTSYRFIDADIIFEDVEREGYYFMGWYTDENFNKKVSGIKSLSSGNAQVYAKWGTSDYEITYDLNGGYVSGNPTRYNVESQEIYFNEPVKDGCQFNGWTDGYGNLVNSIKTGTTGDIHLYANWSYVTYYITYDNTKNAYNSNPVSYNVNNYTSLSDLYCNGYTFEGWYLNDKQVYTLADLSGSVTLKAKWKANEYTITYYLNGGENNPNNVSTFTCEDRVYLYEPTKEEYTFEGWYYNGYRYDYIDTGTMQNINLTAKWSRNNY